MKTFFKKIKIFKLFLFLPFLLVGMSYHVQGQEWLKNLPQSKVQNHTLTLKDYQKAFSGYFKEAKAGEAKVSKEKENEVKDEALEKFKRWEWYWETRVNPVTGAFPHQTAFDVYKQYLKSHSNTTNQNSQPWISQGPVQSVGGSAGLGRINCVAFSPVDTNVLYVGSAAGGVWKTTDGGSNWTPLGDFNNSLGVSDMVVENTGGEDIIYLATGDKDHWDTRSVGVLKSTDGGQSWNTTGLQWEPWQGYMVYRLLVDPNDNNTLYAATNNGLYKTINAGQDWNIINGLQFRDLEFQPGSNTRMYGTSLQNGAIYYSEDKGKAWTKAIDNPDNQRTELAVSPDSSNVVYAVMVNSNSGLLGIYRSKDAGQTYVLVFNKLNLLGWSGDGSDSGGQGWYDLSIAVDPHNANKVFVGGVNTWMSEDGGISWKLSNHWANSFNGKNDVVHADKHELVYQSKTNALFECNDGGIYKKDNGKHWDYIGSGLAVSQIYRLGTSATVNNEVITGLQDNGTKLFSGNNWNDVIGGDGMECLIDYADNNTQYGEIYFGCIYRTRDHWQTSKPIYSGISEKTSWLTPYIIDPVDHNTLYIGYMDVFKTTNQGDSWAKISSWNVRTINSLAISPSDSKVLYAARYNDLQQTKDGGVSWTDVTGTLPVHQAGITYITVKENNPNTLWVTMGGYNNYGVFESTDGGKTWVNISTGLPEIPVNCITQNKLYDTTELFAGTDVGVFVRRGNTDWQPFNNKLPNVVVDELEIHYDSTENATLYAATYGRGLWAVDLSGELALSAAFQADSLIGTYPFSVHFTDHSTGKPTSWKWNFGNGLTSIEQNPTTTYDSIGNYTVSLIVSNGKDTASLAKGNYIKVKSLVCRFSADTTIGTLPLTAHFTDQSVGNPTSWAWDFNNDGTIDATSENPSWTYPTSGLYSVTLYIENALGKDTLVKANYIHVHDRIPDINFRKVINERLGYTDPETTNHDPTKKELASITDLDASNSGITAITGAEYLVNCTTLSLDNNNISSNSFSGGNNKPDNYEFYDKSRISPENNTYKKHFTFTKIPTQTHENKINNINDFSPLAGLTQLKNLSLAHTGCSDISFLSRLTNLTQLILYNNNISDISPLLNLVNLQYLNLIENQIKNISALSNLTGLQTLWLDNNRLTDISALSNLINLGSLSLSSDSISDISALSNLVNLRYLGLGNNPINDLSFLNKMTQLTGLDISSMHLNNLHLIRNLTGLIFLEIYNNNLSSLKGIENYPALNFLYAAINPLYDIRGIENLPLQYIYLYDCRISDFTPLMENARVMGKFQYLALSGNPASKEAIEKQIPILQAYNGNWPQEEPLAACYPVPVNKTVYLSDTTSLTWQANFSHKNDVAYDVYLGTDFYKQPLVARGLTSTSYHPVLQKGKNYWWRVESIFNGDTIQSGVWYFNTDTSAQLITADPVLPADTQSVAITFNAALGDAGLKGFTGNVYAHTGVITDKSTSSSDWKYVKATWNQNIPACRLTRIDTNLYLLKITPSIRAYYGVPNDEQILKLAFVFRSADGSQTGRMSDEGDIFYNVYRDSTHIFQDISLDKGWNIMSFNVTPDTLNMLNLLKPLVSSGQLIKVMDEKGNFVQNIPGTGWMNTIGNMANTEGYNIKVFNNNLFKVLGLPIILPYTIPLQKGWNMMGYPLQTGQASVTALDSLIRSSALIKVIDEKGGFIQNIPDVGWMNTIGNFEPGKGYYIKVNKDTHITLNKGTKEAGLSVNPPLHLPEPKYFAKTFKGNPYYPMNIVLTRVDLGSYSLQPGDEIAVFDKNVCVGATVVGKSFKFPLNIVVSMDDPTTPQQDGYIPGDDITLRYRSGEMVSAVDMNIDKTLGTGLFSPLGTLACSINTTTAAIKSHLKTGNGTLTIYPNPVKNAFTLLYANPERAQLQIEIVDLNGKIAKTISDKFMPEGNFRFHYNVSGLPAGIYTIRVIRSTAQKTTVKNYKLIVVK